MKITKVPSPLFLVRVYLSHVDEKKKRRKKTEEISCHTGEKTKKKKKIHGPTNSKIFGKPSSLSSVDEESISESFPQGINHRADAVLSSPILG